MSQHITLTTDFGQRDPHVAFIKGVLTSQCPDAQIIDLSHEIPRKSALEGALFLASAIPHFPKSTVHIACIATGKTPIAVYIADQYVICPDNGILTFLEEQHPVEVTRDLSASELNMIDEGQSYFGRDVFAPNAAALASGKSISDIGAPLERIRKLNYHKPDTRNPTQIKGQVIHVDHFGNLMTNISKSILEGLKVTQIEVSGFPIEGISTSFADVPDGSPLALIGEAGLLEIAYNNDRADERLSTKEGNNVFVTVQPK